MDWTWLYVIAGAALNNQILLVWKPWTQAYAGEKGKNFARKEDLDKILAEVRAVTIVQKEIEAKVSGAVWDRQTQWNQKRDISAGLLAAFSELELAFEKMTMIDLVTPRRPRPGVHGSRTRRFYINQRSTEGARLGTSVFVPKGCFRRGSLHKDRRFGLGQTAAPFSGSKEPSDRS
jgi:hypothetical protein